MTDQRQGPNTQTQPIPGDRPPTPDEGELESIRVRAERFQKVVDDALKARLDAGGFVQQLREAGATGVEAEGYVDQFAQRANETIDERREDEGEGEPDRERTPEGLDDEERADFRQRREEILERAAEEHATSRREAVDAAAWKILEAKLQRSMPSRSSEPQGGFLTSDLFKLFGGGDSGTKTSDSSIPSSILEAAPHLRHLTANAIKDPHLEETWKLRNIFMGKDALDPIVSLLQSQSLAQPLPRSIWKPIVQDHYVDFEKLFASMEPGYDHNDDPKDFGDGYAIVRKDHFTTKKPLRNEADWLRVFGSWKIGVLLLYPHRQDELGEYERMVCSIFRAAPHNPLSGIQFDVETRQRYAKSPFRMDDKNESHLSILSQLYRASSQNSQKRPSDGGGSSRPKRPTTACHNWNLGVCNSDPCPNRRKHGTCSECGGQHPAKDISGCLTQLQARRRKDNRTGGTESSRPSSSRS